MGIQDFVRHVYAYFVPEGGGDPNDPTSRGQSLPRNPNIQVRNILDSYVPVYNASGDLVQYIERSEPLKKESKSDISQSLVLPSNMPKFPLYRCMSDGNYVPVTVPNQVSSPSTVSQHITIPNAPVPAPETLSHSVTTVRDVNLKASKPDSGWDGWPDGNLVYDFNFKQVEETGKLQVHWAMSTSGGDRKGSEHAGYWEAGKRSSRRCLGVIECDNPSCQIITRPHIKPARIAAQLAKSCRCGGHLVRKECNVISYLWTWSEGIHFENQGIHIHRRPTHLLHLLPGERARFEELVTSHPKSGPLQLIIGVPGLHGPGKSAAEISDVLLNAHRVGKERSKIIKGDPIGSIDKLISAFAKFDKDNPNIVLHSTMGAETVISLQTPFMRSQLVKDGRLEEPINGIVSDATHNWWISPDSLLVISSTYCPVLMCWVPGILTYSNGASTSHFHHHFYALIRSIALEAESRNIPVTQDLFAGMMDFSEAERSGFIEGYVTYFLQRPDNKFTRQELHLGAERLLKGCREHFRASIERVSKMLQVVPCDFKDDFTRRANDLIYLKSTEHFLEQAAALVTDYPNIRNWMEWWTRPAHARMLFESSRDMDISLWNSLPDTNNAEEAMNWKLYQGCGRDHHFLEGMYALLKVAHHYEIQHKAASTGVPIRYGQPEPWKSVAEKQGHTKPSRALNSQETKRKKNNGRPPDTAKELAKSKKTLTGNTQIAKTKKNAPPPLELGPPSYEWNANSCWLDTSLELLFVCINREFDDFLSLFSGVIEDTTLYDFCNVMKLRFDIKEDIPDNIASKEMFQQRNRFRQSLYKFGTIPSTECSHSLTGWFVNILKRSFPITTYPCQLFFSTWYIDFHSCSGSLEWGHHIEIVQPRRSPELQLTEQQHIQYSGKFKDYFRDQMRIDRKPTPAAMCWRVKDGKPLCPGDCEDVKDLILSIPVVFAVEIGIETGGKDCSWDFPDTLYPHTQPAAKTLRLAYDLVGLALFNPSNMHFIARYATRDRKTIYTYDGMAHCGCPKVEPKAKFRGYVAGPNINLPTGYRVYKAFYYLRGGLSAQEQFLRIQTSALKRKFNFVFGHDGFKTSMPSVLYPTPFRDLHCLPQEDRVGWTEKTTTVEYVSKIDHSSGAEVNSEDSDRSVESEDEDEGENIKKHSPPTQPSKDLDVDPLPSFKSITPPSSVPDSLFQLNCRCGLKGDGNTIYDPQYGMAIQCIECHDWSHVACQREGRASNLTKYRKDEFTCDFCSLQGILPPR